MKTLKQSILSSETLINNHKKQIELSSEGKYTTLTFKARKTRYIALENDTRKKHDLFSHAFVCYACYFLYGFALFNRSNPSSTSFLRRLAFSSSPSRRAF